MSEKKNELIDLVMDLNVSAIQILADRLGITADEVTELINELLEEGKLKGSLTEDSTRFFRSEVKLSEAPRIARDDDQPSFMKFNARPAKITAIVGFIIIAGGLIVNAYALDTVEQNFAAVLIFLGVMITLAGAYLLSQRKTPA
jgi:DNA-binding Lrp family transcriptional regulator